jgi:transcription initiation factor TFIIE subunit alpha
MAAGKGNSKKSASKAQNAKTRAPSKNAHFKLKGAVKKSGFAAKKISLNGKTAQAVKKTAHAVKENTPHASKNMPHAAKGIALASKEIAPHSHASRGMQGWKTQLLANPCVRQMLINLAGEHTLHVISEFQAQMSDEEIAKRTKLRTSDVRVVLNKLHSCGLVGYSRSRDKNSGWYSYVWKMNNDKAKEIITHLMADSGFEHAEVTEGNEDGEFYKCCNCDAGKPIPFEEASNLYFKCASCGSNLEFRDCGKK